MHKGKGNYDFTVVRNSMNFPLQTIGWLEGRVQKFSVKRRKKLENQMFFGNSIDNATVR